MNSSILCDLTDLVWKLVLGQEYGVVTGQDTDSVIPRKKLCNDHV